MKNTEITNETLVWNKVENKMTTSQAEAPYLGMIQAKGTIDFDGFVTGVKEAGCSESELEIRRVLTKHEELMKGYVAQNYKVYCPFGIAGVHITKSFPAQDASFDPQVNEAILSLKTNAETRNSLNGVTLKEDKAGAAALKGMKFNSVCTGGTRFGVVVCYQPFTVAGTGLRLNPAKSTDKLTFTSEKTGDVTEVTSYTCDGEGFRIDAQVDVQLSPGKYTLTGYVDMGDAEHPNVLSASIKVTVEAGEAPVPPPPEPIAKSEDGITKVMTLVDAVTGADRVITGMNDFVLDGEGLELAEDGGDGVTGVKFSGPGLEDYLDLTEGARNDGSKLIAGVGSYVDTLEPGDHECHLGLYLKHGEATDLNVWIDFTLRKE